MYKTILSLSFIVATRFFGLFIVLPIFGLYASNLEHSTTILAGVAIGIYALMQVIFQIPFGLISDKFGRKNTMAFGLIIFIIGSLICGFSNDIYLMILGRAIQGSGAVGAVGIAMISDFTKEEDRGKAMAIMGIMIGLSFSLSMVISPILANKFGLGMLFHISTILSVLCIFLLYMVVPKDIKIKSLSQNLSLKEIISDKDLAIMNLTNFLQKMFMTMAFFITPIVLVRALKFNEDSLWIVYVLAMIFGLIAMGLAGFLGEKKGFAKNILIFGVLFFMVSYLFFAISSNQYAFIAGVILFFIGFNMHEPIMQSVASKFAKASQKGTVLGIFNSAGYFGSFIGGLLGGIMLENLGVKELSSVVFIISIIWLLLLITLTNPNIFKNIYFEKEFDFSRLIDVKGFIECYKKNSGFVVKYNSKLIKEDKILDILGVKDGKFKGVIYFIWCVFSIAIVVISMSIFKTKILSIRRGWSKMQRFALGYKVEKIGEFDEDANLILINHKSMVDIMILEEFHPKNLAWVAKKEIGDIFFLGKILSLPNMISIDRSNPRSIVGLIKDAKDRIENGRVIAIFPEGTRGRGNKILKFQDGAKVVAKKLNLRVQPIVLKDTLQILNVKEFTVKKGLVKMKCLEVVDLNDENWYEKTRLNMQKAYDEL